MIHTMGWVIIAIAAIFVLSCLYNSFMPYLDFMVGTSVVSFLSLIIIGIVCTIACTYDGKLEPVEVSTILNSPSKIIVVLKNGKEYDFSDLRSRGVLTAKKFYINHLENAFGMTFDGQTNLVWE